MRKPFDDTRRRFVKLAAAMATPMPGFSSSLDHEVQSQSKKKTFSAETIEYPRRFSKEHLNRISFPLGGIGTGGLELGGRGNLRCWQIFNRPSDHETQAYIFPAIYVHVEGRSNFASFLESRELPPFDLHDNGVRHYELPGMPRMAEAEFHGSFPTACIHLADPHCPVTVTLDAFSPFFPLDVDDSGLPAAILTYTVKNPLNMVSDVSIAWSISNPSSNAPSRINQWRDSAFCKGTLMTQPSLPADSAHRGSFALCTLPTEDGDQSHLSMWRDLGGSSAVDLFWDRFSKTGALPAAPEDISKDSVAVATANIRHSIPAGGMKKFRFLVTWHYPIRTPENIGWDPVKGHEKDLLGNHYCQRFTDAWEVAEYVSKNLSLLEGQTKDFANNIQLSTLPGPVKDAAASNLSTLVSNTLFRIADGSFHGFEGCGNTGGIRFWLVHPCVELRDGDSSSFS